MTLQQGLPTHHLGVRDSAPVPSLLGFSSSSARSPPPPPRCDRSAPLPLTMSAFSSWAVDRQVRESWKMPMSS